MTFLLWCLIGVLAFVLVALAVVAWQDVTFHKRYPMDRHRMNRSEWKDGA